LSVLGLDLVKRMDAGKKCGIVVGDFVIERLYSVPGSGAVKTLDVGER